MNRHEILIYWNHLSLISEIFPENVILTKKVHSII